MDSVDSAIENALGPMESNEGSENQSQDQKKSSAKARINELSRERRTYRESLEQATALIEKQTALIEKLSSNQSQPAKSESPYAEWSDDALLASKLEFSNPNSE